MWKWKSVWHDRTLFFELAQSEHRIFAIAAARGKRGKTLTWATLTERGQRVKGDIQDQGESLLRCFWFVLLHVCVHVKPVLLAYLSLIPPVLVCFLAIASVSNINNGVINIICCYRRLPNSRSRSAEAHSALSNQEGKCFTWFECRYAQIATQIIPHY